MLIDTHCHLDLLEKEKDLDRVLENSKKVRIIVSNGTSPESNRRVLEISDKYEKVKPSLGIYPLEALKMSDEEIDEEIEFIKKSKPIAIGEVGIDYHYGDQKEQQEKNFKKFIKLAKELDIPIIVHSRKAESEVLEILEQSNIKKVVLHCFSGNKELTEKALSHKSWMFTIPTAVVRNKTFRKLSKRVPINNILTETDAPYLSPIEGEPNEPAFIEKSIVKIAELKKITEEEIEKSIEENFQKMFLK